MVEIVSSDRFSHEGSSNRALPIPWPSLGRPSVLGAEDPLEQCGRRAGGGADARLEWTVRVEVNPMATDSRTLSGHEGI